MGKLIARHKRKEFNRYSRKWEVRGRITTYLGRQLRHLENSYNVIALTHFEIDECVELGLFPEDYFDHNKEVYVDFNSNILYVFSYWINDIIIKCRLPKEYYNLIEPIFRDRMNSTPKFLNKLRKKKIDGILTFASQPEALLN